MKETKVPAILMLAALPGDLFNKVMEAVKDVDILDYEEATLRGALSGAFLWDESKDGYDFWENVYNQIRDEERKIWIEEFGGDFN